MNIEESIAEWSSKLAVAATKSKRPQSDVEYYLERGRKSLALAHERYDKGDLIGASIAITLARIYESALSGW